MSEQKEALRKAEASLQDAEKRLALVRKWQPAFKHAVLEYHASVQRLKDLAAGDVPSAVNLLTRIIDALEAYLGSRRRRAWVGAANRRQPRRRRPRRSARFDRDHGPRRDRGRRRPKPRPSSRPRPRPAPAAEAPAAVGRVRPGE